MAVHQCPHCELRFRSESEYHGHLRDEHNVDPLQLEPFHYAAAPKDKPLYPDLVDDEDEDEEQR
jgi:sarcosine oxidase delta subunit